MHLDNQVLSRGRRKVETCKHCGHQREVDTSSSGAIIAQRVRKVDPKVYFSTQEEVSNAKP